jgi:fructose-1,6-bisphosphatase/inositol monophosphatase family enzyme
MNFTGDYLEQAQDRIVSVFYSKRDALLAANGSVETQLKDDKTVVTTHDKEMELELKRTLHELDKGIGFEGEEFGADGSRETFWLVDPIDGTESFVRGLPFFRNMVTLIDNGKPVFTLVYRAVTDELFSAKAGRGAYKNGEKLAISQRPLQRTRIELSTSLSDPTVWPLITALTKPIENFRTLDEFLFVAEGKMDAHLVYKSDTKPWDNAPRMLLLQESGAKVANIGSDSYDYRNSSWLAANPTVFDQLTVYINKILSAKDQS